MANPLKLLRLSPESRSPQDIANLMEFTAGVDFFKTLHRDHNTDEIHKECVKSMILQHCRRGECLFSFGDPGDSFYVLLKGQVSIQIPNFIVATETLETAESEIQTDLSTLPQVQLNIDGLGKNPSDQTSAKPQDYDDNTEMSIKYREEGSSFGELSLLTNQPRAATIMCTKECWLAKLSRADYTRILKDYEEKKLSEMVRFLKSLPFFENWTKHSIVKMTYLFETRHYLRNQVVYRFKDPADHVFIVRSGEFSFTYVINEASPRFSLNQRILVKQKGLKICLKGSKELFGEDDVIEGKLRSLTCTCESLTGEVIAIEKNDFLRRLQVVPSTWEYLLGRYYSEKTWRTNRICRLQSSDFLRQQDDSVPEAKEAPRKLNRSLRVPSTQFRRRITYLSPKIRSVSISQDHAVTPSVAVKDKTFFATQVVEDCEDEVAALPTQATPRLLENSLRLKNRYSPKASLLRMPNLTPKKPPPNFFVNANEAVKTRYKFRPLITGRDDKSLSLGERSFHRKRSKLKSLNSKNLSITPDPFYIF